MRLHWVLLASILILKAPITTFSQQGKPAVEPDTKNRAVRSEKKNSNKRPVEILNVLSEARSAPPEFAADVILRLATSRKVQDRNWKKELLEDAFRLATKGEQKLKRDYAGAVVDTREGYLSLALQLKLDVLSLQSKIVTEMLSLDKLRAREMFSEISPDLKLPVLTCSDALIPDVADFYFAMKRVAQESFSASEIRDGLQISFLQRYVSAMSSPVQVGPIAKVIATGDFSPLHFSMLLQSFIEALKRISADYRAFSYAAFRDSLTSSLTQLIEVSDRKGVPDTELLQAMRAYLIKSFTSTQCIDNTVKRKNDVPGFIKIANQDMLKTNPILFEDIQPSVVEGSVKTEPLWQSSKSKDMLWALKQLRFGPDEKARSESDKATPAWHKQLTDFLNELDRWSASDEQSELEYFHQKGIAYRVLSEIVPSGLVRENIWRSQAAFLSSGYMQDAKIEWFLHANHLLNQIGPAPAKDRQALIGILELSPNSVLRTYAHFYEVEMAQDR